MAQSPAGSSSGSKGSSPNSGGGKSSGGGGKPSGNSPAAAGKEIERLAGKVPAAKADRAQAGKAQLKGKWENFPGGKAFQG